MFLVIDTADGLIRIFFEKGGKIFAKLELDAIGRQSELLLKKINHLLDKNGLTIKDVKGIRVKDIGGGFTSLRIGIVTANALAYSLGVELKTVSGASLVKMDDVDVVLPKYEKEPNITIKKSDF